jgi:hypothetical protein
MSRAIAAVFSVGYTPTRSPPHSATYTHDCMSYVTPATATPLST